MTALEYPLPSLDAKSHINELQSKSILHKQTSHRGALIVGGDISNQTFPIPLLVAQVGTIESTHCDT